MYGSYKVPKYYYYIIGYSGKSMGNKKILKEFEEILKLQKWTYILIVTKYRNYGTKYGTTYFGLVWKLHMEFIWDIQTHLNIIQYLYKYIKTKTCSAHLLVNILVVEHDSFNNALVKHLLVPFLK